MKYYYTVYMMKYNNKNNDKNYIYFSIKIVQLLKLEFINKNLNNYIN